ncbi:MAG TPA: alpha-hydroxy acid oxidase [Acidimicrobiales bacterium]|nr:alpha-hydroxy acid oxidase [Acidimicrobiales bacterium]
MPAHPARTDATGPNPGGDEVGGGGETELRLTGSAPPMVTDLSLEDLEQEARRAIGEMAYAYYAGGADDERLLRGNVDAWGRWQLHPRVLAGVSAVSTATTVLGWAVASPVGIAPTAIQGLAHPEGEVATARGAAAAGALLILSSLATCPLEDVAAAVPPDAVRWMQIYVLRERARTAELVARTVAAGYRALVLTVDAPVSGLRLREWRTGVHLPDDLALPNLAGDSTSSAREGGFMAVVTNEFEPALTPDDIGWLRGLSELPVVVKGVQRADDAVRCVDAGAAAVIVSNHGARQLADAPATADILAEVVDAVGGRAEVYVDGGLRRAPDVVKALALGARAALVGRPSLWALATGGADGVAAMLHWFESELRRSMALCGAATVDGLDRGLVRPAPGGPATSP